MAFLWISEYASMPVQAGKFLGVADEPALVVQPRLAIGGASAASFVFDKSTKFVRLHTDAICSVKFGAVATLDDARLAANATEFFGVRGGDTVNVIANT